jgi:hypothetical protein
MTQSNPDWRLILPSPRAHGSSSPPQAAVSAVPVGSDEGAALATDMEAAAVPVPDDEVPAVPVPVREADDPRLSCIWIEPQDSGADDNDPRLNRVATVLRAAGYRVLERRWDGDGELRALLAVGSLMSAADTDSVGHRRDLAAFLEELDVKGWQQLKVTSFPIPAACFRGDGETDDSVRERGGFWLQHYGDGEEADAFLPPDLWLRPDEPDSALLDKFPPLSSGWTDWCDMMKAAGNSLDVFSTLLDAQRTDAGGANDLVPLVVEGLLPAGEVVVLVGESEAGKSTLAHQIGAAITSGAEEVLGYPVMPSPGGAAPFAVILAGEESAGAISLRKNRFRDGGLVQGFLAGMERDGRTIAEALAQIEDVRGLRFLVVDPASAWIGDGDEDKAGAVSEFLELLRVFARRKGCCVLVLHHIRKLSKRGQRTRLYDLRTLARGSGVWIERPRVVLGLVKNPDGTRSFGVIKSNLAPHIGQHEIRLSGDPVSSLLHRLEGTAPARARAVSQAAPDGPVVGDDAREVAAAVAALRAGGGVVRKTGARGLFKLRPPGLDGWSRDRTTAAVAAAMAAGLLVDGRDGLVAD